MTFTVFACETVTGLNRGPVPGNVQAWSRVLNGGDQIGIKINQGTLTPATRNYYRGLTEPAKMSLVLDWDGIALAAGPIWNRPPAADSVTVNASGLEALFVRRKVANLAADPTQVFAYTGISLGTIAQRLVQLATASGKPGASLPIVLPGDETDANTDHQRTYAQSDLKTVGDMLSNLTGVIGGPDIDFAPEWVDSARSAIRWRMRVGTQAAPRLTSSNVLAWDYSTAESGVKSLTVGDDASGMATAQWARGEGDGTSTLMSLATSTKWTSQGYPLLEQETDYTDVSVQSTLDSHTAGDLAAALDPTVQYALKVDAAGDPPLGAYQLGDVASVRVKDHWWIEDSPAAGYGLRILGISGDASNDVQLTVQGTDSRGLVIVGSPDQELPLRIARLERLADAGDL